MKKDFENVGIMELAASKKSLKITLDKLPYEVFTITVYASAKNTEEVLAGRKPTVTVVRRIPQEEYDPHLDL